MLKDVTWKLTANIPFHSNDLHAHISHFEKTTPVLKLRCFGKEKGRRQSPSRISGSKHRYDEKYKNGRELGRYDSCLTTSYFYGRQAFRNYSNFVASLLKAILEGSGVSTQMKLGRQILKLGSRGPFYITTVTITIIIITTIASNDGVKS